MKKITVVLFLVVILSFVGCAQAVDAEKAKDAKSETVSLSIAAGPAEGIYYGIAESLAVALQERLGYELKIIKTEGSTENLKLLAEGKADLAISMLDMATHSYKGTGVFEGQEGNKGMRLIADFYPSYMQIVTTADTEIKDFQGLRYKRVGVGAENSGTEWNARQIFKAFGMTYEDCLVESVGTREAIDKINRGELDVAFITAGAPNAMIEEIEKDKKKELVIIPIEGEENKKLLAGYSYFQKGLIPKDTYGKNKAVETLEILNVLVTSDKMSDKVAKNIMTCISDCILEIQMVDPMIENMSVEQPLKGTTVPLHQGVVNYFEEK